MWMIVALMTLVYLSGILALSEPAQAGMEGQHHPEEITVNKERTAVDEWSEYSQDAYEDYSAQFTALFRSYETKWSKNHRLMIRQGDSGPYKFTRKAA